AQLDRIPDSDVPQLQKMKREAAELEKRLERQKATAEADLRNIERDKLTLAQQYERLSRSQGKLKRQLANQRAALDIQTIVAGAHNALKTTRMTQVSKEMNRLFLEMINA